ncbi:MAG TPA: hypothetical protein VFK02_20635 [Kofleriaceae bacterium]|nr:hypothetical protein [Kofleriaceae bacterium]
MTQRIVFLAALALALVGCKQGIGERCQINADCASNHCSNSDPQVCVSAEGGNMGDIDATVPDAIGLLSFGFLEVHNRDAGLIANVTGRFPQDHPNRIEVTVPVGTTVTGLIATFTATGSDVTVAGVPQISGVTANDFTNPVTYRFTSLEPPSTLDYTVTVTVGSAAGP